MAIFWPCVCPEVRAASWYSMGVAHQWKKVAELCLFMGCFSVGREGGMTAVYRFGEMIISRTLSFNYRNIFHVISRRFGNSEILGSLPELLTHWVTP